VNVGRCERLLAHLDPYARDVVIAGGDRNEIGVLIFPVSRLAESSRACHDVPRCGVLAELRARLNSFAKTSTGSSNRLPRHPARRPPSLDAGEMTDKGSSTSAVLTRRADLVAELYARASPRVLVEGK
jgi:feruloyl-CoA synthase